MYLKKVEICGFKTFADKTDLTFAPGISGIVGPNGCGKSNLIDAIRWCLGETRASSLRCSNMKELIFAGTTTRQSSGMSEVSLTFDNSQNVLPIEYAEVTVTRRMFKTGESVESEYFINKNQCRLKDIKDLFLDTGIGPDGYSIIEQDKVKFLTTAKPEDRRSFFEEAAGVARYKVRREEALRKLEKIDADMGRLSDSLEIHKEQIEHLDKAAKKAKEYQKYQEDLAKHEVAALVSHIKYGKLQIEKTREVLEPKFKEFEISNTTLTQTDAEILDVRMELDAKNNEYVNVNSDLGNLKAQISACDQKIQHALARIAEISDEQEELTHEIEISKQKSDQMSQKLNYSTDNTGDSSVNLEISKLENTYKEKGEAYNLIRSKMVEFEAKEDEVRAKIVEIENEKESEINFKSQSTENKIRLDSEIESIGRMIKRLEEEVEPSNVEIANLEQDLISLKEDIDSSASKKQEFENKIKESEESIAALKKNLAQCKNELSADISRIETLKEFDQKDPIRASINAVLSLGTAKGPIGRIINAKEGKEHVVICALGDKLNYLICQTAQDAERSIEFLEDNNLHRLSFIIAEKINDVSRFLPSSLPAGHNELIEFLQYNSEYEKVISFLCSDMIIFKNKIYSSVIVSGGVELTNGKPILIEDQIKKLNEKVQATNQKIAEISVENGQLEAELANLRFEKSTLDNNSVRLKAQFEVKEDQIEEKRQAIRNNIEEIASHKAEIEPKITELSTISEKLSIFEDKIAAFENQKNVLEEELKAIEASAISIKDDEERALELMMNAHSELDKKVSEFENNQKGRQDILDSIESFKYQVQVSENKLSQNSEKLADLTNIQETETEKMQKFLKEQEEKETQIQVLLNEREELQTAIDLKSDQVRLLRAKTDTLKSELDAIQVDLKNFEFQSEDLKKRLFETYCKEYEVIKDEFDGVEANATEISRLKRKMELLGPVNLAAQEEYDALEKRYNFILTQQSDLLKAKEDLLEVVKKTNESTIGNFKKTFEAVRENFKGVYKKLFGGGEADLMLTDENNLLECGVDIRAQPPGKKSQNISLCSGGEKSLTSVALLFAFFMVKVSPFCILDEVDAPLDVTNVGKYNAIVREFSQKTQFLIITHHNRTAEISDVLYGVTTEGKGVSKIFSIKMIKQDSNVSQ
ncbi:MAG: AAA family ATPase [Elusimicrobiota bacterium]|jgi:chromosome segregation protein|nr:AAA family ATPase [Elusimicrobiota bacterium]